MKKYIEFEYANIKYVTYCKETIRDEYLVEVRKLEQSKGTGDDYFIFLMAYIYNNQIKCRAEATLNDMETQKRAEDYNNMYIEQGVYLAAG